MHNPIPLTRDLVLIGGGHTHALLMRRWGMNPLPGVRLTLINPAPTAAYSGMLPGYVAGHYPRDALDIDLVKLARHAGARLIMGKAHGMDRQNRRIHISGHADIPYDIAAIDIGITAAMPGLPGFAEYAQGAKPLTTFADRWHDFTQSVITHPQQRPTIAVIGAGVAGVELAMAIAHYLEQNNIDSAQLTLLETDSQALRGMGHAARRALLAHLKRLGITLMLNAKVTSVTPEHVLLKDGRKINTRFTVGAAGAQPHNWLNTTGLDLTEGFITVNEQLCSVSDPRVYAVGDCAHFTRNSLPKAGVFAVRQAPVLCHNLRVALSKGSQRSYRPQRDYLKLISTGGKGAVADKFGLRLDGRWLWHWKDYIDRRFMAKFTQFPAMPAPALPKEVAAGVAEAVLDKQPLCGACGAKVAGADLQAMLTTLPAATRTDVLSAPGDDAAILQNGAWQQVITTDHLRAFTEDPWLVARVAAIHALGDIWAMGAKPQAALATIILPRMNTRLQQETLREIMAAATAVFTEAGASIVGGHSSIGAELTVGFSVTGLTKRPITQAGAQAGDKLILTKPLGSGTIMAAEMLKQASGAWVDAAYQSMQHPLGRASALLTPAAHAMTDVTGFGLAGHLMAILQASNVAATLDLEAIPLLDGAEQLARDGVRSSLWEANRALLPADLPDTGKAALLFDPQTAGGLLVAIAPDKADHYLQLLKDAGENAAFIGTIEPGVPKLHIPTRSAETVRTKHAPLVRINPIIK